MIEDEMLPGQDEIVRKGRMILSGGGWTVKVGRLFSMGKCSTV
jgi:hypothetical protein